MNSGRGRGGSYRGRGGFRGSRHVEKIITIGLPNGSIGMVVGRGGCNIKDYQARSGIEFVHLDQEAGTINIGGTSNDVEEVEMHVQNLINKFNTKNGMMKGARGLHIVLPPMTHGDLSFVPADINELQADFNIYSAGRDFYRLSHGVGGDFEPMLHSLSLDEPGCSQGGTSVHVPADDDALCTSANSVFSKARNSSQKMSVEIRMGGFLFHSLSTQAKKAQTVSQFKQLAWHSDYKTQFSTQLRTSKLELEDKLRKLGFEVVDEDRCTVAHVVSGSTHYAVVFVEDEEGNQDHKPLDPRMKDEKRRELERIAQCASDFDILEVRPGSAESIIKKAFHKKSLMVHPDKNGYGGATEAIKVLAAAVDALLTGVRRSPLETPLFEVTVPDKDPPKIAEFWKNMPTALQQDFVEVSGGLGRRVAITSKTAVCDSAVREFLEQQWQAGSMVQGGTLGADHCRYSIDTVRFKERQVWSDGTWQVDLQTVKQKALEGGGRFQTFHEVTVKSTDLNAAITEAHGEDKISQLFRELIESTAKLSVELTS